MSNKKTKKAPPQAPEIEKAVIKCIVENMEPSYVPIALDMLNPDDIYQPDHEKIFQCVYDLYADAQEIDMLTVAQLVEDRGGLKSGVSADNYLIDLPSEIYVEEELERYCSILKEKSMKRQMGVSYYEMYQKSYDDTVEAHDLLSENESMIMNLGAGSSKKVGRLLVDIIPDSVEKYEIAKERGKGIVGIPSGLKDLDNILSGFQKTNLYILAARPSMGKTGLALTLAKNAANPPYSDFDNEPAVVFSMEMGEVSLADRFIGMHGGVNIKNLQRGTLTDSEEEDFYQAAGELQHLPIILDDTPTLSIVQLRSKVKRYINQHSIRIVFVDYLQLMSGKNSSSGNREQEIASISRGLKKIAMEENIPVVALSQLSRAVESRGGDKRPQLSDLRESGAIEQDADVVMFLYRPEYYKIDVDESGEPTKGVAECIVAKQRNGPVGTAKLFFEEHSTSFRDLSYQGDEFMHDNVRTPYKDDWDDEPAF